MRRTNLRPLIVREIDRLISSKAAWLTQRYGLQPADTADIKQEGWVAALKALPGYNKSGSSLATYLAPRVLFYMLNSILRAQARGITGAEGEAASLQGIEDAAAMEAEEDSDDSLSDAVLGPVALQDLLMDERQADAMLANMDAHTALLRLGVRERNLIALYFGLTGEKPKTLAELAARNRQPITVIYRRIQRGLDMLKDDLEQEDGHWS